MSSKYDSLHDFLPDISPELMGSFELFYELIREFNGSLNLIGSGTLFQIAERHFADCYKAIDSLEKSGITFANEVYDLGSGNGFPGVVLALMHSSTTIHLIERDQRKSEFLKHLVSRLGLVNIKIHSVDVRNLDAGLGNLCISRAMAPMNRILMEARKLVPTEGHLYLLKNEYWTAEFGALPPQLFDFWDISMKCSYEVNGRQYFIVDCKKV